MSKILLSSVRNWVTSDLSELLEKLGHETIVIAGDRNFGDKKQLVSRIVGRFTGYRKLEFLLFDILNCFYILWLQPDIYVGWLGSTRFSFVIAKYLGIKRFLWHGEMYDAPWRSALEKRNFYLELIYANVVLCESSYVKNTFPDLIREKVKVCLTPVNLPVFHRINVNSESNNLFEIGLISTAPIKNTAFVMDCIEDLVAKGKKIKLNVYGDHSYFRLHDRDIVNQIDLKLYPKVKKDEALFREYMCNDVFLFPSLGDAGPRGLVEVAGLGIKVICSEYTVGPDILSFFSNLHVIKLEKYLWLEIIENTSREEKGSNEFRNYQINLLDRLNSIINV